MEEEVAASKKKEKVQAFHIPSGINDHIAKPGISPFSINREIHLQSESIFHYYVRLPECIPQGQGVEGVIHLLCIRWI